MRSGLAFLVEPTQAAFASKFDRFLPRATFSFDVNDNTQVYGNIIAQVRAPIPISAFPDLYNVSTGVIAQVGTTNPPPEHALGEELGLRYHNGIFTLDTALFNKKLTNNSVISQVFLNGIGVNSLINAGGLNMRGATVELAVGPFSGVSIYANAQYLKTKTTSNLPLVSVLNGQNISDFLPTKGKEGPGAPNWTINAGLSYDKGPFFGNIVYKYTSDQWGTFLNDGPKMPGYSVIDLNLGLRLPEGSFGKEPVIRLSVNNLSNTPRLTTLVSIQSNMVTTTGINGGTVTGKPWTAWLGSPRSIIATVSTKF